MTVIELIHQWANKKLDSKGRNVKDWSANETTLHNGWLVVGKHFTHFTLIRKFSNRGLGSGYSDWEIKNAMPHKEFMVVNDIPSNVFDKDGYVINKDNFINFIKSEFVNNNENVFDNICLYKDYVTNNRRKVNHGSTGINFRLNLPGFIINNYKDIIYNINIKTTHYGKISTGWGFHNYTTTRRYYFDSTIGQLLKNKKTDHFTRKELYDYRFKRWRLRYLPDETVGTAKKYYTNKKLKNKTEKDREEYLRKKREQHKIKLELERKEKLRKDIDKVNNWINGSNGWLNVYSISYNLLRLNEDKVQTSGGVNIDIDKEKLLYKFIKNNKIDVNTEIPYKLKKVLGYTINGFERRYINYILEDNRIYNDYFLGIVVGCHFIPLREIDRFIKHNKLQW